MSAECIEYMAIKRVFRRAKGLNKRIIFPEGEDERIIKAADLAAKQGIIKPILVGNESAIRRTAKKNSVNLAKFKIIEPAKSEKLGKYISLYSKLSKVSRKTAERVVPQPLFYSALTLRAGDADGMIGGIVYTSGDFIAVCKGVIGLRRGIKVPSSFFVMELPGYKGGEKGNLLYSDASVNPNPSAEELADIAISTGQTAKSLLGWKPRVALLSFSTKGSAQHPDVCKVINAVELAKRKAKGMQIDGELQADTALRSEVAKKKIKGNIGKVAGKANVLIFPDLDAGNIAYKLTQILAGAKAYGPILQGFAKPVSDLSRGAKVEDVVGVIKITAVLASRWK